jgi:uncharacterized protein (TIGR02266 family)
MMQSGARARRLKKLSQVLELVNDQRQAQPPALPLEEAGEGARQHERAIIQTAVDFFSESNFYTGIMDNISEGGIFVATFETATMGARIQLEFSLPDKGPPVRVEGEVRWSRDYQSDGDGEVLPGIGLRFVDLSEDDKNRITVFVSRRETIYFDDEL